MNGLWNGGSDPQAGVEICLWLILSSQNDPLLGPNLSPPCGQLADPYLYAHKELGPNFKLCTQIKVPGPASYPVSHWPCPGRAGHAWE